ncbi:MULTISPECIES: alpha/beta hydrolase [unclassified Methylophaga]|jgi:pimeloyl-ACP methyl ester carboxylesterase|uniref:alpha/beta fold hydrolase n=1 Tax=unclassified Methylophaga TaxID=2629249 RepID=UPI000C92ECB8|nr:MULTISPECIES: alpha/beta hydrolase [unclassified Methylophaga]MAK66921.1 alpha/beta hydrolase [Methylophaga sp.]MAY17957.1 alpha/beta hydrolase [Methylophaga sp.]MBN47167.1 alpha/beta hydrolase [Methylophaga sp.]HCD03704.1 alpha/beta hydrolase [Methylophaga sp.]|tara:strand:+ start:2351 stop:3241 length:891 start_codon:yes stop_codon:yes gene_type:complete
MKALIWPFLVFWSVSAPLIAAEFPAIPGKRFDVGGYQLHINCTGSGSPTVIVDVGLGDDSTDWQLIQQAVSNHSKICVFDRPGYGWSDFGPSPRTSNRIADELETLLEQADIPPPYILVGHSFGGYNIRIFAANNPQMVAGMVLVDASHEDQYKQFQIKLPNNFNRRGTIMILPKSTDSMAHANKPPILRERAFHAARAEISALDESSVQLQKNSALPVVPLIVISRGKPEWYGDLSQQQREKTWITLQQDLSRLSPISTHMFAHQSGHAIPHEQPEIIIEAIEQIVSQVHARNTL